MKEFDIKKEERKNWIFIGMSISAIILFALILVHIRLGYVPYETITGLGIKISISRWWDFFLSPIVFIGSWGLWILISTLDDKIGTNFLKWWGYSIFILILIIVCIKWGIPLGILVLFLSTIVIFIVAILTIGIIFFVKDGKWNDFLSSLSGW